ncbi:MAG: hypothetical protein R3B91_15735 [Planctomycetaceae bacterium]
MVRESHPVTVRPAVARDRPLPKAAANCLRMGVRNRTPAKRVKARLLKRPGREREAREPLRTHKATVRTWKPSGKAANLVLKRLEDQLQRGEIDPELREELGVTDDQLQEFTDRLRQRLADTGEDSSPEAKARRQQFNETLRNLQFESTGTSREEANVSENPPAALRGRSEKLPLGVERRRKPTKGHSTVGRMHNSSFTRVIRGDRQQRSSSGRAGNVPADGGYRLE